MVALGQQLDSMIFEDLSKKEKYDSVMNLQNPLHPSFILMMTHRALLTDAVSLGGSNAFRQRKQKSICPTLMPLDVFAVHPPVCSFSRSGSCLADRHCESAASNPSSSLLSTPVQYEEILGKKETYN